MKKTGIHERVDLANSGQLPNAICKLKSGWVIMGDVQPVDGYCILLSDPVATDLNSMEESIRLQYCADMLRIGDAILQITDAYRINYETWCNLDPALHTHITPRYMHEPYEQRIAPVRNAYDMKTARPFDATKDGEFIERMRRQLHGVPGSRK